MKNPFLTYGYNGPEYFCNRAEETKRLTSLLVNGNHINKNVLPTDVPAGADNARSTRVLVQATVKSYPSKKDHFTPKKGSFSAEKDSFFLLKGTFTIVKGSFFRLKDPFLRRKDCFPTFSRSCTDVSSYCAVCCFYARACV